MHWLKNYTWYPLNIHKIKLFFGLMTLNHFIKSECFTKHSFKHDGYGYQAYLNLKKSGLIIHIALQFPENEDFLPNPTTLQKWRFLLATKKSVLVFPTLVVFGSVWAFLVKLNSHTRNDHTKVVQNCYKTHGVLVSVFKRHHRNGVFRRSSRLASCFDRHLSLSSKLHLFGAESLSMKWSSEV